MKNKNLPKELLDGQLVYACIRNYKGGRRRLILHEATIGPKKSFMYGSGKTWTTDLKIRTTK